MSRRRAEIVTPWAAIVVCVLACIASLYQWRLGVDAASWLSQWGVVPARLFSAGELDYRELGNLISATLVHVDLGHLLGNLVFLALFAPRVEGRLGSTLSLALYLFCGALANLAAAWQAPGSSAPIVGASGVVSALLGAFLVLFPRARIGVILPLGLYFQVVRVPALVLIGSWLALQLVYTFWIPTIATVAWWTHIAGFLSGLVLAAPARWYRTSNSHARRTHL